MNLTQTVVAGLEPGELERIEWDDKLRGFGLRVLPSGRKTWVVQYRAGRRQRRMRLGDAAVVHANEALAPCHGDGVKETPDAKEMRGTAAGEHADCVTCYGAAGHSPPKRGGATAGHR